MSTSYTPPKVELPPPVKVSPFIRFCRWSLLLTGIAWGLHRQRVLTKKQADHRANLRKQKVIWDEEQAKKKNAANRVELLYLAKETNTPVPANFDQVYPPN